MHRFDVEASRKVDVTNETHDTSAAHEYVVMLDTETGDALTCTCLHYVHRSAFCKHMAAVEDATADGSYDAVPTDDDTSDDGPHITGLHIGHDKDGNIDHRYWRCEHCGTETTDKRVLDACC